MAGIHHVVVIQGENLGFDALYQGRMVSSLQIGSPNATMKQNITNNNKVLLLIGESKMTGSMTRHEKYLKHRVAKRNFIAIVQKMDRDRKSVV